MGESHTVARAKDLEERCEFAAASVEALLAGDPRYAARLAAFAGESTLFEQAAEAIPAERLASSAEDLASRGLWSFAAQLFEAAGERLRAAEAYARGGNVLQAARAYEQSGKPAEAARALETRLTRDPSADEVRVELAELLARHGRNEMAVRALQQLDERSALAARAWPLLARLLEGLGLSEAAHEVSQRLEKAPDDAAVASPPPSSEPEAIAASGKRVVFGRYRLEEEIARTAGARLFRGVDLLSEQTVAVKLLSGGALGLGRDVFARFEREAKALGRLRHPAVVPLLSFIPEGPAMVLEWMSGGSLADLQRSGPLSPRRASEVAAALLSALGEAHRMGILHRDVKPSNVMFDEIGSPRLSDFGAAHLGDGSKTVTAGALGTFAYMSPEQRLGQPAGVASDLFGVGVLLFEMVTGELTGPAEEGRCDPPPSAFHEELSEAHDAFVASLCAKSPGDRPQDAFAARRALLGLSWPEQAAAPQGPRSSKRPSLRPGAEQRLAAARDGGDDRDLPHRFFDLQSERDVLVWPLDPETLHAARGFARANARCLPWVLRASEEEGVLWTAVPQGDCLADRQGPLPAWAQRQLEEGLAALHETGGVHGCIDSEHIYLDQENVSLAFPRERRPDVSADADVAALRRLGGEG